MLRIWGRANSINVQKVMWTAAELGLDHERIDAGGAFGRLDTDEYGALNPNRRVPTLVDDDTVVWESNVIVRYLAAKYGAGGLCPDDPAERARADQWMDWFLTTLIADLTVVFWQLIRTPEAERDMTAIEASVDRLDTAWDIVEAHLAGRDYMAGAGLTMGDIPVGAAAYRYHALDIPRPERPRLHGWYSRLAERPAFQTHVMLPLT